MAVSVADQTGEVPSFADRLGERFVVAQPSGALLEFLVFHPGLSSAPSFESSVKARLKRLSNFRHASYARATRLQRDPVRGNRLTLVSGYTAGRRVSDLLGLARRGKIQPPLGGVLSFARQLMTGAALLHDYAPDVFHGALGPERLVVASDGRLVITEYILGTAVEQAVPEWGVPRLWRECRLAVLSDPSIPRFGRRMDIVQIGLVILSLLNGRLLADGDFPSKVPDLLNAARETSVEGEWAPLGEPLRDWLGKLLGIEPDTAFRTLVEAQKAFNRVVEDDARYALSPEAIDAFFRQCEEVVALAIPEPPSTGAIAAASTVEPAVTAVEAPSSELTAEQADAAAPPIPVDAHAGPAVANEIPAVPAEIADPVAVAPVDSPIPPDTAVAAPAVPLPEPEVPVAPPPVVPAPATAYSDAVAEMLASLKPVEMEPSADPFAPWLPSAPPDPAATPEPTFWTAAVEEPRVDAVHEPPAPAPDAFLPSFASKAEPTQLEPGQAGAGEPEIPRASDHATSERRAAVLSYDEVHRVSAPRRLKTALVWAAAVLVVLAVAGIVGGPRIGALLRGPGKASEAAPAPAPGSTAPGGFKITTQPNGSRVSIDGTPRGKAPLQVADLAPGLHSIAVESDWGTLEETVTVEAGKVVPLALATVGWIVVEAPVELEVSEEGRNYGMTGRALMVPAGRHAFIFSNRSVAVRHRQFVQVSGGQTVKVPLDLPEGMLNLTSDQPAQVLLDGEVIGDTPQVSVPAALGPHQVVFRSARLGDVSYTVNVTLAAPVTLAASYGPKR